MQDRLWAEIGKLASDPLPRGVEHLKGSLAGLKRVRVGDYRIGYQITDDIITVLRVDYRGGVYGKLERARH